VSVTSAFGSLIILPLMYDDDDDDDDDDDYI